MLRSPTYQMANELADGKLAERLTYYREHGVQWDAIANLLRAEHNIWVSGETLRRWHKKLVDTAGAAA